MLQFVRDLAFRGSKYHLWFFYQIMAIYLLLPFLKRITDGLSPRQLLWLIFIIALPTTLGVYVLKKLPLLRHMV